MAVNARQRAIWGKIGGNLPDQVDLKLLTDGLAGDIAAVAEDVGELGATLAELGTAAGYDVGAIEGSIPILGAGGKLPASMVPVIDIAGVANLQAALDQRPVKAVPAAAGNFAALDAAGNLTDSGAKPGDIDAAQNAADAAAYSAAAASGAAAAAAGAAAAVADDLAAHAGDNVKHLPAPGGAGNAGRAAVVNAAGDGYELAAINVDLSAYYTKLEIDAQQDDQDAAIAGKTSKVVPAAAGNLAALDANGNLIDSAKAVTYFAVAADLTTHADNNTRHVPTVNAGTNGKVLVSGSTTTYWSYLLTTAATSNTVAQRDASGNLAANAFVGSGSQLTNISPTQLTGWPAGTSGFLWYSAAGTLSRVTGQTARDNMGAAAKGDNVDLTSIRNGATGAPGTDGVFEGDGPTDGGIGGNGTNLTLSNGGPGGQGGGAGDDGQTSGSGGQGGNGAVMRLCCGGPGGMYGASGNNNYGNIGLGGHGGTIELVCGGLTGEEYTGNAGTLKIALGEGGTVYIGGTIHLQGGTVNIGGEGSTISAFGGPGLNGAIVITGESDSEKLASLLAGLRQIGLVAPAS
jgi:hypothetical protein